MKNDSLMERYGPRAVVTGASSGIGRATAEEPGSLGLNVVLVARRGEMLCDLAADLRQKHGIQSRVIEADLASRPAVKLVVDETADLDVGLPVADAGYGTMGVPWTRTWMLNSTCERPGEERGLPCCSRVAVRFPASNRESSTMSRKTP